MKHPKTQRTKVAPGSVGHGLLRSDVAPTEIHHDFGEGGTFDRLSTARASAAAKANRTGVPRVVLMLPGGGYSHRVWMPLLDSPVGRRVHADSASGWTDVVYPRTTGAWATG